MMHLVVVAQEHFRNKQHSSVPEKAHSFPGPPPPATGVDVIACELCYGLLIFGKPRSYFLTHLAFSFTVSNQASTALGNIRTCKDQAYPKPHDTSTNCSKQEQLVLLLWLMISFPVKL